MKPNNSISGIMTVIDFSPDIVEIDEILAAK
jgi:hypothetical protein